MRLRSSEFEFFGGFLASVQPDPLVDDPEIDELIIFQVADNADGFEPTLHALDLLAQELSQFDDTFVADAQMLLRETWPTANSTISERPKVDLLLQLKAVSTSQPLFFNLPIRMNAGSTQITLHWRRTALVVSCNPDTRAILMA